MYARCFASPPITTSRAARPCSLSARDYDVQEVAAELPQRSVDEQGVGRGDAAGIEDGAVFRVVDDAADDGDPEDVARGNGDVGAIDAALADGNVTAKDVEGEL